jgi:ubiquinol-cytochrome c reductase cytochrome b subunit
LHETGSNKPLGVPRNYKKIRFQKGYRMKDLTFLFPLIFLLGHYRSFSSLVADPDNFIPANPLVTPTHIQPE